MSKIAIIEDNEDIREILSLNLIEGGHEVVTATNGREGLNVVKIENPEIVILDIMMPEMDGYEVCRRLRQDPQTKNIYIIMLSAKDNSTDKITGLDTGADAYLTKPFVGEELQAQIRVGERTQSQKVNSDKDLITGLYSRRSFKNILEREIEKSRQLSKPLCLAKVDIDNFFEFIKKFGLKWGEKTLWTVADLIKELSHKNEVGFRWSNNSFIWVMPDTEIDWALVLTEDLRSRVNSCSFLDKGEITVSIGVASLYKDDTIQTICSRVEDSLSNILKRGGNEIEVGYKF